MPITALAMLLAMMPTVTAAELTALSPRQLAERFLPAEDAKRIKGGEVARELTPWESYRLSMWGEAVPHDDMLCRREAYNMRVSRPAPPVQNSPPDASLSITWQAAYVDLGVPQGRPTKENCARVQGFATTVPGDLKASVAAIRQLVVAMRLASGSAPLPFKLACRQESGDDVCADARASFARLPLKLMSGSVMLETGRYVTKSLTPMDGGRRMVVRQMVPTLTGQYPIALIGFRSSPPRGLSWRVRLVSGEKGLEQVEFGRTYVISH